MLSEDCGGRSDAPGEREFPSGFQVQRKATLRCAVAQETQQEEYGTGTRLLLDAAVFMINIVIVIAPSPVTGNANFPEC